MKHKFEYKYDAAETMDVSTFGSRSRETVLVAPSQFTPMCPCGWVGTVQHSLVEAKQCWEGHASGAQANFAAAVVEMATYMSDEERRESRERKEAILEKFLRV